MIKLIQKFTKFKIYFPILFAITTILTIGFNPTLAADPFRNLNGHSIGKDTQEAFEILFEQGNYEQAKEKVIIANENEPNEPLAHALRASLAYTEEDWETLKTHGTKTRETATKLVNEDAVRGNLYIAVGHFLEGTYIFYQDGAISAIPKLQQVFSYLEKAEKISPEDPELNLIKGYMDVLLAVSLPFSSADDAIQRLQDYGAPEYLVTRGIAIAYRDLKKYDRALEFVNKSLKMTPENPEVYYLKAQILYQQGKVNNNEKILTESIENFKEALKKSEQLPQSTVKQLKFELNLAEKRLTIEN